MDSRQTLSQAAALIKAGNKTEARNLLVGLIKKDPRLPDAWLYLSACFDEKERKLYCLEKALEIDPNHAPSQQLLARLGGAVSASVEPPSEPEPQAYQVEEPSTEPEWQAPSFESDEMEADADASTEMFASDEPQETWEQDAWEFEDSQSDAFEPEPLEPDWMATAFEDEADPLQSYWEGDTTAKPPVSQELSPAGQEIDWDAPLSDQTPAPRTKQKVQKSKDRPPRRYAFYEVWISALFSPSESTFHDILRDPDAKPSRGYLWVFITSLIVTIISVTFFSFTMQAQFAPLFEMAPELGIQGIDNPQQMMGYVLIGSLCLSPIYAGLSVLGIMITAGIYQLIAKFLVGEGIFGEMAYALSAFSAPLYLISAVLVIVPFPFNTFLGLPLSLYGLYLTIVAIKAVNRFDWRASCFTVIAVPLLIFACSCCLGFLAAQTASPVLENFMQMAPAVP